jgi:hypothetical protein
VISRILAVIGALGMVFGAYVFRYGMPGGDGGGTDDGGGGRGDGGALVCAAELGEDVCAALGDGVTVEPAATTAKRLLAARGLGDAGITGWVAPGPWPAMVDSGRSLSSKPALFAAGARIGLSSTPLVAVARKGQLPAGCDPVAWKCLGDAAQDPTFRLGGDPATTSSGVFVRAAALAGYFGRADYATNDLDEDVGARPWLDNVNGRLAAAAGFGAGSLQSFVLQQGSARAYLTTGATAAGVAGGGQFHVRTPAPAAKVVAAFTPAATRGARIDAGAVRKALRAAGWADAQPSATDEGLPSPGVLLALSEVGG